MAARCRRSGSLPGSAVLELLRGRWKALVRGSKLPRPGKHTPVQHQQAKEIAHWHGSAEAVGKVTNQAGTHCDYRDGHRSRELSPWPDRIRDPPEWSSEGVCSNKMSVVGTTGLEPAISCSQSRRASHYATSRRYPAGDSRSLLYVRAGCPTGAINFFQNRGCCPAGRSRHL